MYQNKILITILSGDSSAFTEVAGKEELIFPDEPNRDLYKTLYEYFLRYNKIPSRDYLEDFFQLEKSSLAKKSYESLDDVEVATDDLLALVKLQLNFSVKNLAVDSLSDFSNKMQISPASSIKDVAFEYQSKLATLTQNLEEDSHKQGAMFGSKPLEEYKKQYQEQKESDRGYYIGNTGFAGIDDTIGGIHNVDLITLIGFTNQGKSPLMRQIAYNMLMQGLNVVFLSIEMDFSSIQTAFYSLHANNYKVFGFNNPKITTSKLRQSNMTEEEEDFLFNVAAEDFHNNDSYGTLYILQPTSTYCYDEMFMDLYRVHQTIMPVDMAFIDYAVPLLQPSKNGTSFSKEEHNEAHRRMRKFGLTFDNGRGLPLCNAAQVNRNGFLEAIAPKNKENLYNIAAIGDFNAIEKDSTHIVSILQTDEMVSEGVVQLQHLKARESSLFPHHKVQFDGACGAFRDTISTGVTDDEITSVISELEL